MPTTAASQRDRERLLSALAAAGDGARLVVDGHEVPVTHLDRVYWPAEASLGQAAITKRDFLRYLVTVAPLMLPHLAGRPLTVFRWPEGIAARRVLHKHLDTIRLPAFVSRVNVWSDAKGHPDQYVVCNNLAALVWLGHMGVLEFHPWHSRITPGDGSPVTNTEFAASTASLQRSILSYPDYLLFDIDPYLYSGSESKPREPELNARAFAKAKAVARWLKALLDRMTLASFVKTSGKTGLHIVVPTQRTLAYDAVREVGRIIGQHLTDERPDDVTMQWSVDKRAGRVFVDANMNVRGKSIAAPYSARALPGAPVSMPLGWRDLDDAYPLDFRLPIVLAHARKRDPWAGVVAAKQSLAERIARAGRGRTAG